MKYLKNIAEKTVKIEDLIAIRPNQILSVALTNTINSDVRIFSLAKDEEIYNEKYEMDTIYLCLKGELVIIIDEKPNQLCENELIAVSLEAKSHIVAKADSLMLQIMVKETDVKY